MNDSVSLDLHPLNVLIGKNGSGKSNFISFFSMLSEMMDGRLQQYVTKRGQAVSFLYQGLKKTTSIKAEFQFSGDTYTLELEPTVKGELMFVKEGVVLHPPGSPISPFQLSITGGYLETALRQTPSEESLKKIVKYMGEAIRSWKVYHFHDTSSSAPVKQSGQIQDNQYFRPDAANLAPFLFRLKNESPSHYLAILDAIKQVAPFFYDFKLEPLSSNPTLINLEWTSINSDFPFRVDQLSDGILRFICLVTLLLQPNLPATIIIDEPELGLHPFAIAILSGLLKKAASRAQVIIATQSVTLIDTFDLADLIIVEQQNGASFFHRPDPEKLKSWLHEYSLGQLWEKNVLGGISEK
ncbi:MAG: AAA family ATPase [Chlamydiae bacterium]|nr:AAA family ATPase [Chlamydiota bacterium]